jgi:hypothetical protein
MRLMAGEFDRVFAFSRPIAGAYRDRRGIAAIAAAGVPRFDHDAAGRANGLLVETGPRLGTGDRCRLKPGQLQAAPMTVLHWFARQGDAAVRRAYYSTTPAKTIDAALAGAGHHLLIAAVPGFLRNLGGFVRYRGEIWSLAGLVEAIPGAALADAQDRPLLTG